MRSRPLLLFLTLLTLLLVALPAGAQDAPRVAYERYDVEIDLRADGSFTVREIQTLRFNDSFSEGFAEIPQAFATRIDNVRVAGGPADAALIDYGLGYGTQEFNTSTEGDTLVVNWTFPQTQPGDRRTFVVAYDVTGGLWVYPDFDTLEWRAVAPDRSGLDVPASRVTVTLPFPADQVSSATAFGPAFDVRSDNSQVVFEAREPLADGTAFQVLVEFPHGLVTAVAQPWQIAADSAELAYRLPAVDVAMTLTADGLLQVVEQQQVAVDAGTLYEGFRSFTWRYLDSLQDVFVREGDQPFSYAGNNAGLDCENCFTIVEEPRSAGWAGYSRVSDEVEINEFLTGRGDIRWRVPPLVAGESTTFTLAYTAVGTVSLSDDRQLLTWTILPDYPVPVEQVSARLTLPPRVGLEDVAVDGATPLRDPEGSLVFERAGAADAWTITVTLPPDATSAAKPLWQTDLERALADAEAIRAADARRRLILTGGGLLAAVVAALGGLVAWYLRGSRKLREALGGYRTEPPSDLAPGLVSYLMAERPTPQGALATLLHLADLGLVRIVAGSELQFVRVYPEPLRPGARLTTAAGATATAEPHVVVLFNALLPQLPQDTAVDLDAIVPAYRAALPDVYARMGEEMVTAHYSGGRRLNLLRNAWIVGALLLFGCAFLQMGGMWRVPGLRGIPPLSLAMIVFFGFFLIAILSNIFGGLSRSRTLTDAGKREARKWAGFKAYLKEIQRYGDLPEAQAILDRYFAYAVALDVEQELLQQVQALGGTVPIWLGGGQLDDGTAWQASRPSARPWYYRPWYRRGSWQPRPRPSATTAAAMMAASADQRPALQRVSDSLTGALDSAGSRMTGMLNTAAGQRSEPVNVRIRAAGQDVALSWDPDTPLDKMVGDIVTKSQSIRPPAPKSSGSSGGFRGGSGGSRSGGSRSSSRSSGSRRSGGGGSRGFR